jgi:hypothetical protein
LGLALAFDFDATAILQIVVMCVACPANLVGVRQHEQTEAAEQTQVSWWVYDLI